MKTRPLSPFICNFRAPGSQVDGPIRYAFGDSTIGMVLIARSSQGICAIFLGNDAKTLYNDLVAAFPVSDIVSDQDSLQNDMDRVVAYIDKDTVDGSIKLDVAGTRFEQKVWHKLCAIPEGETRTYGAIARDLGQPKATRAVAAACAANVIAIAIPCHRVIRKDGALAGYRWGLERKRTLLIEEGIQ